MSLASDTAAADSTEMVATGAECVVPGSIPTLARDGQGDIWVRGDGLMRSGESDGSLSPAGQWSLADDMACAALTPAGHLAARLDGRGRGRRRRAGLAPRPCGRPTPVAGAVATPGVSPAFRLTPRRRCPDHRAIPRGLSPRRIRSDVAGNRSGGRGHSGIGCCSKNSQAASLVSYQSPSGCHAGCQE